MIGHYFFVPFRCLADLEIAWYLAHSSKKRFRVLSLPQGFYLVTFQGGKTAVEKHSKTF